MRTHMGRAARQSSEGLRARVIASAAKQSRADRAIWPSSGKEAAR